MAVSRSPAAVVSVPETALSGTVKRMARSLQPLEPATGAVTLPAALASVTPPVPGAAPNPKPSITAAWPRTRMGSIAPST